MLVFIASDFIYFFTLFSSIGRKFYFKKKVDIIVLKLDSFFKIRSGIVCQLLKNLDNNKLDIALLRMSELHCNIHCLLCFNSIIVGFVLRCVLMMVLNENERSAPVKFFNERHLSFSFLISFFYFCFSKTLFVHDYFNINCICMAKNKLKPTECFPLWIV